MLIIVIPRNHCIIFEDEKLKKSIIIDDQF
jgi:hypothetical protein